MVNLNNKLANQPSKLNYISCGQILRAQEPRGQLIEQWEESICSKDVLHTKQVSVRNSTFLPLSKHDLKTKYK